MAGWFSTLLSSPEDNPVVKLGGFVRAQLRVIAEECARAPLFFVQEMRSQEA